MTLIKSNANLAFLPTQASELIVRPVSTESVAIRATRLIETSAASFRIPVVSADPSAAWIGEGSDITASDATLTEAVVEFKKLAGLSIVSNELLKDSDPAVDQVVGNGLARDIARKLDAAFLANTTSNGPSGLLSLTTSTVDAGSAWSNLDPFTEAQYSAEAEGATITTWIANPVDAQILSKLKEGSGSNKALLGTDPSVPGSRNIAGAQLLTSPYCTAGTIWGIPADRVIVVVRQGAEITVSDQAYFSSDRTAIRATLRVGFAFPHPLALVKIALEA